MTGRPWMWVLTDDGRSHATATAEIRAGAEISAVCGAMVMTGSALVTVQVDPCLPCLQLVGTPIDERTGTR